jgi:pyridinium-3,5-biscarboxylic acid mononucleotide synthase
MTPDSIKKLLQEVATGQQSPGQALAKLKHLPFEDIAHARVDHHRALRTGLAEVIYGEGKTAVQIKEVATCLLANQTNVLVTRLSHSIWDELQSDHPEIFQNSEDLFYDPLARVLTLTPHPTQDQGTIAVICAGTCDLPVAREAILTAQFAGLRVETITDVGVAGLHRLLPILEKINDTDALIVVAGMDGALPSVVAGLLDIPVIAVPTSVGYGTSFGGVAALLTMLNSCASGVVVVNIDNGFGAAAAALRTVRRAHKS